MRVSLRWLREYVEVPEDPEAVAAALGGLGHEVEALEERVAPFGGVVVARVMGRRPHPNADRLQLVEVEADGRRSEVVCGAWNFEVGDLVPLAPPGAVLAGGQRVGEREIRGVRSQGMICSEAELGLGDDAEGIMVLGPDLEPGTDLGTGLLFPDVVLDLSITTNRPDCMSMVGIARELAAYYQVELHLPQVAGQEAPPGVKVEVRIDDPDGCPRYVARPLGEVRVAPSPLWLQARLRAAGQRPINNVVDVTNFVMLELGNPIHAFDLARLEGGTIVVRRARPGETLRTLDGVERHLDPKDLVIADSARPVALAGVIGGEDSEVGPGTEDVLIESAYFDPATVLLGAKRHGLRTEASSRFERGVDPNLAGRASERAASLLGETGAAVAAAGAQDVYPEPIDPWRVDLPLSEVGRLLGVELGGDEVAGLLRRLELEVSGEDPLVVTVPTFRPDLTRPADLVEEAARLYGYDRIPETLPTGVGGGLSVEQRRLRLLRQVLVGAGYFEAQTLSFLNPQDLERLGLPEDDRRRQAVEVANPLREQEGLLRTTILPGLLQAVAYNRARRLPSVALFEVGRVFSPGGAELPDQPEMVAFVATEVGVLELTGLCELLASRLHAGRVSFRPETARPFHPGRAATVLLDDEPVGTVGELHPMVVRAFDLEGRMGAGELALAPFLADPGWWQLRAPSPFPPVVFDLAFELDEEVPAGALLGLVRGRGGDALESVEVFDVYRGEPLPRGRKSVALRLVVRAPDRTLSDEEVAPLRAALAAAVAEELGGRLRGG